jgi:hypothetical protein
MDLGRVVVAVPDSAKARLERLDVEVGMALDQMRALQGRANAFESGSDMHQRIISERDKFGLRHTTLHRLLSATNQFLFQLRLRPGEVLQPVAVAAELRKGETAAEAVGKLRIELLAISQQLAKVRAAPLPVADLVRAAEEYVARRAAGPRVRVVRDQLQVSWQDDVVADKQSLLSVLCWLAPTSVLAALKREITGGEPPSNAMPAAQREAKVAQLSAALLDLERKEVALLDDTTLPRPDTNPLAYLQVAIVAKEAATAAA